jgi:hypothetical protein
MMPQRPPSVLPFASDIIKLPSGRTPGEHGVPAAAVAIAGRAAGISGGSEVVSCPPPPQERTRQPGVTSELLVCYC